jgi:hypothetical protein
MGQHDDGNADSRVAIVYPVTNWADLTILTFVISPGFHRRPTIRAIGEFTVGFRL